MKFKKDFLPYIIIILVVVLIRTFIATPVRVDGISMNPTFDNGDILVLNKMVKKFQRMDILVFDYKGDRLIKRLIALPGEKVSIKDNKLYINDEEIKDYQDKVETKDYSLDITIPEGYYFVLGDNRYESMDSRYIGLISEKDIKGIASVRIFPFNKFTFIKR